MVDNEELLKAAKLIQQNCRERFEAEGVDDVIDYDEEKYAPCDGCPFYINDCILLEYHPFYWIKNNNE